MRVTVIPMSSGEFDVQVERDDVTVSNYQVARPTKMLEAMAEDDAPRVIRASFDYLLERGLAVRSHVISLDKLWRSDPDFADTLRERLS